jgi:hypothetical protein
MAIEQEVETEDLPKRTLEKVQAYNLDLRRREVKISKSSERLVPRAELNYQVKVTETSLADKSNSSSK